jgi:hypothetical protein
MHQLHYIGVGASGTHTAQECTAEAAVETDAPDAPERSDAHNRGSGAAIHARGTIHAGAHFAAFARVGHPVTVAMPNVVGKNAAVAQDELKKLGFNNIEFGSSDPDDKLVLYPPNWRVVRQSTPAGQRVSTDTLTLSHFRSGATAA